MNWLIGATPPATHTDTPKRDSEHYDGVYAAHGPDRSRASVQPCTEHRTEDQP